MTKETYEKAGSLLKSIDALENMGQGVQSKLSDFFAVGKVYRNVSEPAGYVYDIDESRGLSRAALEGLERIICGELDSKIVKLRKELAEL